MEWRSWRIIQITKKEAIPKDDFFWRPGTDSFTYSFPEGMSIVELFPSSREQATAHWAVAFYFRVYSLDNKKEAIPKDDFFWRPGTDSNRRPPA